MRALLLAAALLLPAPAAAETLRIWGPPAMQAMVQRWADAFTRAHPGTRVELTMKGSDTAVPGLYGGVADIALMGRPNDVVDDNGFSRTMQRKFTRLTLTSGSLSVPGKSDALALLVNAGNPVRSLSAQQIDAIFNCDATRKIRAIRTWGDLGATGAWAKAPIRIYSYDLSTRTGAYFQQMTMRGARKMCWDHIREYGDARRLDATLEPAATRVGNAARADRYTLALANPGEARDGLKTLAIEGVTPSAATVIDGSYPLARRTYAFVDRAPGVPLKPAAAAFLRFVLSEEGQNMLAEDRGYLPLDRATAAAQRAILEAK